jgi:hypothetical protein
MTYKGWGYLSPRDTKVLVRYTTFLTFITLLLNLALFVVSDRLDNSASALLEQQETSMNFQEKNDIAQVYANTTGKVPTNILAQAAYEYDLMTNPGMLYEPLATSETAKIYDFKTMQDYKSYTGQLGALSPLDTSTLEQVGLDRSDNSLRFIQDLLFGVSILLILINTIFASRLSDNIIGGVGVISRWG